MVFLTLVFRSDKPDGRGLALWIRRAVTKQKVLIEVSGSQGVKSAGKSRSTRYIQGCQGRLSMFIIAARRCSWSRSKPVEYGT
jgi:hypothetical protein